jgi:hypothetical protein
MLTRAGIKRRRQKKTRRVERKIKEIVELVKNNNVALVTDAGTPGISDPGTRLINELLTPFRGGHETLPKGSKKKRNMIGQLYHAIFYQPIFNALVWFYNIIPGHDVGVAIILVTIILKV